MLLGFRQISLLSRLANGVMVPESVLEDHDALYGMIGGFQALLYLGTAIPFIMWLRRAHQNLPALGARKLKYSPGWAVGGWFAPFLNLVRPYQVVREVWVESESAGSAPGEATPASPSHAPVGLWWFLFLAMNVVAQLSARMMLAAETNSAMTTATWVTIVADGIGVLSAIAAVSVVRRIQANQTARNALRLASGGR